MKQGFKVAAGEHAAACCPWVTIKAGRATGRSKIDDDKRAAQQTAARDGFLSDVFLSDCGGQPAGRFAADRDLMHINLK